VPDYVTRSWRAAPIV